MINKEEKKGEGVTSRCRAVFYLLADIVNAGCAAANKRKRKEMGGGEKGKEKER